MFLFLRQRLVFSFLCPMCLISVQTIKKKFLIFLPRKSVGTLPNVQGWQRHKVRIFINKYEGKECLFRAPFNHVAAAGRWEKGVGRVGHEADILL